jgi:hypothetical protein
MCVLCMFVTVTKSVVGHNLPSFSVNHQVKSSGSLRYLVFAHLASLGVQGFELIMGGV